MSRKRVELALCTDGFVPSDTGQHPQNFSLVLLQCLLLALYLIVLSVRYLIQLGSGRFCLIFLAMRVFLRKVFIEPISSIYFDINNKQSTPFFFSTLHFQSISTQFKTFSSLANFDVYAMYSGARLQVQGLICNPTPTSENVISQSDKHSRAEDFCFKTLCSPLKYYGNESKLVLAVSWISQLRYTKLPYWVSKKYNVYLHKTKQPTI